MPSQIYTILYISECRERTSSGFLVVNATGYARLENNSDKFQKLNITAFYPTDDSKPCYLPKLVEGQVLSVSNSKFAKGVNGELDLILNSASILNIPPEDLPIHQIMVVGIATATETATTNEYGVQVECVISDYLSKDKLVETPITLFHPPGSRFANQTTMIKRGSSIFFSGALTQVETNLYLELHTFSFIRNQTFAPKQMPWTTKTPTQPSDSSNIPDNFNTPDNPPNTQSDDPTTTQVSENPTSTIQKTLGRTRKNPPTPVSTPVSTPQKRNTRSSYKPKNKARKLADIASDIIAVGDSDIEEFDEQ
ncbi:hypothetical protein RhiirA1_388168 [Rhizophagus irregularis]|uniref:Uncharacterized protein n=1 Tax=Rhizophagus irregularis TaxID=588596 RepID=A0A2N0SFS3_9GLOM|nr:hypothetical protein RhiirA1_388168 [Rhizophagus irregularis]